MESTTTIIRHRSFSRDPLLPCPRGFFVCQYLSGERNEGFDMNGSRDQQAVPSSHLNKTPHLPLTLYDVLGWNGLLFWFVANLIGFRRYKVNEFSAAVHHQLPGIVGHPDVGQSLFDHLIDSSSRYSEIIIVARGGSHRISLSRAPRLLKNSPALVHCSAKIFPRQPSKVWSQEREKRVQKMKGVGGWGGAGSRGWETPVWEI